MLQLDDNARYSCSLQNIEGLLLRTVKSAEKRRWRIRFSVNGRQSLRIFFDVSGIFSTFLYVTLMSHTYIDYHLERGKLPRRVFVEEGARILPLSFLSITNMLSTEKLRGTEATAFGITRT